MTPRSSSWLFARLAAQNLGRQPARTLLLALTVAVGIGAVVSTLLLRRAIDESMGLAFSRMGADLLVVPRESLVNLTAALLTVEPSPHTLAPAVAEQVARLPGVRAVATQRALPVRVVVDGHLHDTTLVAFDPARDFTVLPWVTEKLDRPLRPGDVLVGGRRPEAPGTVLELERGSLTVWGRLGLTSVGPFDHSLFASFATAATLAPAEGSRPPALDRPTGLLVRLDTRATPEQVRFALAALPAAKVVAGAPVTTSVRQTLTTVLGGAAALTALMLLAAVLMVGALYSALLAERRRELGLLLAIGTRRAQVVRLILAEAALTTAMGGLGGVVLGGALLLLCQRSLGFTFAQLGVPFVWPSWGALALHGLAGIALAAVVGLLGACVPAWRVSGAEPYVLVRADGQ